MSEEKGKINKDGKLKKKGLMKKIIGKITGIGHVPEQDIIFTPHGITDDDGEMLDIRFEPDEEDEETK